MQNETNNPVLTKDEWISAMLRQLFEAYGYKRFRMEKFQPYDMYNKHRSFIESESILTFTDRSGRLMAVKPDVTLAIAAGISPDEPVKKVFYHENVFRSERGEDIREISQTGVEAIGDGKYVQCEVAALAVHALQILGHDFVLLVGNVDYLGAFEAVKALDASDKKRVFKLIGAKNLHGLRAALDELGVSKADAEALLAAVGAAGEEQDSLQSALRLAPNEEARAAAEEVKTLLAALDGVGLAAHVRPDFSLVNNLSYYNGIVFQGYVKGVPACVLSGGRYDAMMRRLHKPQQAIGFALRLSELQQLTAETCESDCDVLIIGGTDAQKLSEAKRQIDLGKRVRVADADDGSITYRERLTWKGGRYA